MARFPFIFIFLSSGALDVKNGLSADCTKLYKLSWSIWQHRLDQQYTIHERGSFFGWLCKCRYMARLNMKGLHHPIHEGLEASCTVTRACLNYRYLVIMDAFLKVAPILWSLNEAYSDDNEAYGWSTGPMPHTKDRVSAMTKMWKRIPAPIVDLTSVDPGTLQGWTLLHHLQLHAFCTRFRRIC